MEKKTCYKNRVNLSCTSTMTVIKYERIQQWCILSMSCIFHFLFATLLLFIHVTFFFFFTHVLPSSSQLHPLTHTQPTIPLFQRAGWHSNDRITFISNLANKTKCVLHCPTITAQQFPSKLTQGFKKSPVRQSGTSRFLLDK